MQKSRGLLGYVIMIAAFLLLAYFISDSMAIPPNRITYPELLDKIAVTRWIAYPSAATIWWGAISPA
ncbi:MAG: hypothetical protein ACOX55_11655 [Christensenellales bacterium]